MSYNRNIPVFHRGREYNQCLGSAKVLQFIDEVIQLDCCLECYFDKHGIVSGDTVTFDDIGDCLNEGIEFFLLIWLYFQINKSFDMITKKQVIDLGMIPRDNACFFHFLNAGRDCGRGKKDFGCNIFNGGAGICLQNFYNLLIN